jgi:hypothetical protein
MSLVAHIVSSIPSRQPQDAAHAREGRPGSVTSAVPLAGIPR